jgi:hypothetical protein
MACHCFLQGDLDTGSLLEPRTMKQVRFTEDQIIGVLREYEAGAKTGVLPEAGLSDLKAELEQLATDARAPQ